MDYANLGLTVLSIIIVPLMGWAWNLQRQIDQLDRDQQAAMHALELKLRADFATAAQFQALETRLERALMRIEDKLDEAINRAPKP